jgi:DNA-binding NtrC family response regulator
LKKQIDSVSAEAIGRMVSYQWPGNIRELENLMERMMLFCDRSEIGVSDLPPEIGGLPSTAVPAPGAASLKEAVRAETERVERELIQKALDETGGNVTQAARKLKISRKSLQTKMKELGLRTT